MRAPRILSHVLDNESKSETLGFLIFIVGAVRAVKNPAAGADEFLWCVVFSSILVGGKMVAKTALEAMQLKVTGGKLPQEPKNDPPAPATP